MSAANCKTHTTARFEDLTFTNVQKYRVTVGTPVTIERSMRCNIPEDSDLLFLYY